MDLHPDTALRSLLEFTALSKNLDHLSEQDNQVVVTTTHQSKGLEFDHVFIAGMSEGEFTSYHSAKSGEIEEEKRLFYGALTRAKKNVYISGFTQNRGHYPTSLSRFITAIPTTLTLACCQSFSDKTPVIQQFSE